MPLSLSALVILFPGALTPRITVDQIGYLPSDAKVAVFADAVSGQNVGTRYTPGPKFEIRRVSDGKRLFTGSTVAWNGGATSDVAGDRVWHGSFSGLKTAGTFVVYDPANDVQSFPFRIAEGVYDGAVRASTRTFYYQRAGTPITKEYGGVWNHRGGHLGEHQDRAAEYTQNGASQGKPRNLLGGWYDAGDVTKYVPFLVDTVWDLMFALERNPVAFRDDTNIPESGNTVPDLVDEIKWELDWLLKMQDTDGGVFNRNGSRTFDSGPGNISTDTHPRFYTAKTTWATATAAAILAHASRTFSAYEATYPGYSAKLKTAAVRAWRYLEANPNMLPINGRDGDSTIVSAQAESNANDDRRRRVFAAAELLKLTNQLKYRTYFETWVVNLAATEENGLHPLKGTWKVVDPLNHTPLTMALFVYSQTPNPNAQILADFKTALSHIAEQIRDHEGGAEDPYLAWHYPGHYTWGSNSNKGRWARTLIMSRALGVNPTQATNYLRLIRGYVHFIHGRNALAWCFLSNSGGFGADKPVMSIYHQWFDHGNPLYDGPTSKYGPAPGFLAGGPNQYFTVDWIKPPFGEPPMKAYRDWNAAWNAERQANENSWEITEPAIYYQAAYTLMLAESMK